jgi:uncharacterized low-complexity protein
MKNSYRRMSPLIIAGLAMVSVDAFAGDLFSSPFEIKALDNGYLLAVAKEGKCGQDNIQHKTQQKTQQKSKQGSCGEGKCGNDKTNNEAVCGIYQVGSTHNDDSKVKDGKCGGHKVVESLCGEG